LTILGQDLVSTREIMSNSSNQTPTLSNAAEIAKNIGWVKNNPLQWSSLNPLFILIPHSAGISKITRT
tara:strand:- start:59 stop:262 length:204 start_codon:yes stop_codon:yes gene_type:complete